MIDRDRLRSLHERAQPEVTGKMKIWHVPAAKAQDECMNAIPVLLDLIDDVDAWLRKRAGHGPGCSYERGPCDCGLEELIGRMA